MCPVSSVLNGVAQIGPREKVQRLQAALRVPGALAQVVFYGPKNLVAVGLQFGGWIAFNTGHVGEDIAVA